MHDDADRKTEEAVDLAHPLGVAFGEVVVDGDDVNAAAGEGVQVAGKGGDQGLAFAGLHLGDFALVEDGAADELHVEVAHADGAFTGFADYGEGFREDSFEGFVFGGVDGVNHLRRAGLNGVGGNCDFGACVGYAGAEFGSLSAQLVVRKGLNGGLEGVDLRDEGHEALDGALVAGTEDFR